MPSLRSLLATLLVIVSIGVGRAQDERTSPLPSHLPLRIEACFGRAYDSAHLAQHPKQRVTSFHLLRDFTPDPNTEREPTTQQELREQDGDSGNINVTAYVRLRDRPGLFSNGLSCRKYESGEVRCGIDCDGGGFKLRANGQSLLLDNEGFVVAGGCGASDDEQERSVFVEPGADDKLFRLDRKPIAECAALREADRPAWAKRGPPIRARLASDPAGCYARSYDAAHLARNPRQTVQRIAFLKGPASPDVEAPSYRLTFRVETKDGRRFEKTTLCSPDNYAYACSQAEPSDTARDFFLTRAGEGRVTLRDRNGMLARLLGAPLAADDRLFSLQAAPAGDCAF